MIKRLISKENKREIEEWYDPKGDKWWNHPASYCIFPNEEDAKSIYDQVVKSAGRKVICSTEIKPETISSVVIKILKKVFG